MKTEKQVCTIEQAGKLKELGVEQTSEYAFIFRLKEWQVNHIAEFNRWAFQQEQDLIGARENYSAFTVAELGEMLETNDDQHFLMHSWNDHGGEWQTFLSKRKESESEEQKDHFEDVHQEVGETEAEARAEMLIWMLENKIISVESVNENLA